MSARTQRILLWWSVAFGVIYGLALVFLLRMVPPPRATWSAEQIARFYVEHSTSIRIGAVISSWTGAFFVPFSIVVALQMARLETGRRVWAITAGVGGVLVSLFLVLPPIFWGVAAYTPTRSADATSVMHELGMVSFWTTDQFFVFMWVPLIVICFRASAVPHSPFPRWFGYYSAFTAAMFEPGAVAYLTRTGPFAWHGLLVFPIPLAAFTVWLFVTYPRLFAALRSQQRDEAEGESEGETGQRCLAKPAVVSG